MNYNRRPNRPDANVYRQMRRQTLGRSRGDRRGSVGWGLIVFAILLLGVAATWIFWK